MEVNFERRYPMKTPPEIKLYRGDAAAKKPNARFAGVLIRDGAKTGLDQEKQEQQMFEEQSRTCHANKRYTMLHVALIVTVKS